jgi:hypothetical protein
MQIRSRRIIQGQCTKAASSANYSRQLLEAIEKVDGLVTGDEEGGKSMLDREAWRCRISKIVIKNISSNSGHCRTRSEIVV